MNVFRLEGTLNQENYETNVENYFEIYVEKKRLGRAGSI